MISFDAVLRSFADAHPDLRGVIFCDDQGNRVWADIRDDALAVYDMDVFGAQYAAIAEQLRNFDGRLYLRMIHPDGATNIQLVDDGYYVVVISDRGPRVGALRLHLSRLADELIAHM